MRFGSNNFVGNRLEVRADRVDRGLLDLGVEPAPGDETNVDVAHGR
jgi:hypothetical protein